MSKVFKCEVVGCGFSTTVARDFREHNYDRYYSSKNSCVFCGQKFGQSNELRGHLLKPQCWVVLKFSEAEKERLRTLVKGM